MPRRSARNLALFLFLIFVVPIFAFESYDLIEALIPKGPIARVLNSTDIDLKPTDPQPLFTPNGDFNKDNIPDMAISGIYDLPTSDKKYFLLVGTQFKDPVRYEKLFFREFDKPVFLHQPGSTGDKDPGDQAFSITFCSQCNEGLDFYWNAKKKTFDQNPWVRNVRTYQSISHVPMIEALPQPTIDKALKIAGNLKDVKIFVAGLKKSGGQLGTRVEPAIHRQTETVEGNDITQVKVHIFEKKKKGEVLYDTITIDTDKETVISRKRKVKLD